MKTTATVRINIPKDNEEKENQWNDMSLMDKFRYEYKNQSSERSKRRSKTFKKFAYAMIAFQTVTQPYVSLCYLIPRYFDEYDEWTQYFLKVLILFLIAETLINYFCTIFYRTDIQKTRDSPDIQLKDRNQDKLPEYFDSIILDQASSNKDASDKLNCPCDVDGFPWKYCEKCDVYQPPRAHHCPACEKCIIKRDHHCYFVGTCIGFRNQRYFFVLNFYAAFLGICSFYLTFKYLQTFYCPHAYSWTDFFPPVAIYRWLVGVENLRLHIVILIINLYNEFLYGLFGIIYFTSQTVLVIKGITLYEFTKEIKVKCNNSINHNFRSVFGDFWALNFLFPMTIIFKQREDGLKWEGVKMNYNRNNNILKGIE